MNHGILAGFTCFFLLLSLTGLCVAEEAPEYTLYIQGGESSIAEDADGGMQITIQDVVPYIFSGNGNKSLLLPVRQISLYSFPMNAALVFSGPDGESVSLVQISHLSLSDTNKELTLQIAPLEFYEGEMLKEYAKNAIPITSVDEEMMKTVGVYLEGSFDAPDNVDCPPGCRWNEHYCGDFRGWICCPTGPCTAIGNDCVC
jgi:hypothetical protein